MLMVQKKAVHRYQWSIIYHLASNHASIMPADCIAYNIR